MKYYIRHKITHTGPIKKKSVSEQQKIHSAEFGGVEAVSSRESCPKMYRVVYASSSSWRTRALKTGPDGELCCAVCGSLPTARLVQNSKPNWGSTAIYQKKNSPERPDGGFVGHAVEHVVAGKRQVSEVVAAGFRFPVRVVPSSGVPHNKRLPRTGRGW